MSKRLAPEQRPRQSLVVTSQVALQFTDDEAGSRDAWTQSQCASRKTV